MNETRVFTREELLSMGLPWDVPDGGEIVSDRVTEHMRWSVGHELIFRLPGQPLDEAWRVTYSVGATESQDETPWQYSDRVTATLARRVTKTVVVWE